MCGPTDGADARVALIKALLRELVAAAADNHALARRTRRQGTRVARQTRAEIEAIERLIVALAHGDAVPAGVLGPDPRGRGFDTGFVQKPRL